MRNMSVCSAVHPQRPLARPRTRPSPRQRSLVPAPPPPVTLHSLCLPLAMVLLLQSMPTCQVGFDLFFALFGMEPFAPTWPVARTFPVVLSPHPSMRLTLCHPGLFAPRQGQVYREEQRRRRSHFDRGTPGAEYEAHSQQLSDPALSPVNVTPFAPMYPHNRRRFGPPASANTWYPRDY